MLAKSSLSDCGDAWWENSSKIYLLSSFYKANTGFILRVVRRLTSFLDSELFIFILLRSLECLDLFWLRSDFLSSSPSSPSEGWMAWFSLFSFRASLMVMTRFLFSKTWPGTSPTMFFSSRDDKFSAMESWGGETGVRGLFASLSSIASCLAFHLSLRDPEPAESLSSAEPVLSARCTACSNPGVAAPGNTILMNLRVFVSTCKINLHFFICKRFYQSDCNCCSNIQ